MIQKKIVCREQSTRGEKILEGTLTSQPSFHKKRGFRSCFHVGHGGNCGPPTFHQGPLSVPRGPAQTVPKIWAENSTSRTEPAASLHLRKGFGRAAVIPSINTYVFKVSFTNLV